MSQEGNGFDKMPCNTLESIFETLFGKGYSIITICTGEVKVPLESEHWQIIKECHASAVGGYKGETKTLQRIKDIFYWQGMKEAVLKYVKTCGSF